MTTLTVVIVSYNTREQTLACLDSLVAEAARAPGLEVSAVVVDNGSSDGSAEAVRARHPAVLVIDAGENLGFAAGVNRGAAQATGEYVLLLNPDTTVLPGALVALVDFAQAHPEHGLYGGRTLAADGSLEPSSCWGAPSLWSLLCFATGLSTAFARSRLFDPESLGRWQRDTVREVPVITGCLLLIARFDWNRLGGMDERFFLYGEDADFSLRAAAAGMRPVIVPAATIVHTVGGSTSEAGRPGDRRLGNGRKMSMVMAGKATLLKARWSPARAVVGIALLRAGALTRGLLERAVGRAGGTWGEVWRRRGEWSPGYPAARAALFGTAPVASARAAGRPLVIEAEPAFRTEHANPYTARLYRSMSELGMTVRDLSYWRLATAHVDVVHLHWPELTFLSGDRSWRVVTRLVLFFGALRVARRRGTRVVWTVHNVVDHEQRSTPALRARLRRLLTANVDGILSLSASGVEAARRGYPELEHTPAFVTPHGHYRADYDFSASRTEARARLDLDRDGLVAASIGQLRPYKNVPHLLEVFRGLDPDARLAIAGRPSSDEERDAITDAAAGDPRIVLELAFQPAQRVADWLRASDLVVLPYRAIENSGSAILALSANRPVLVPRIGAMGELAELVGPAWVRTYDGEFDAAALAGALAWARDEPRPEVADLSELEWGAIAAATLDAYRAVLQPHTAETKERRWVPVVE
ncbi:glycosyltransferase [Gryllotalpicola protaetiae]|uniref:Glycosyltransferase n=1 Tax=Gryllotalpicola protaetiae TaxID=2419771 RepID=A0A387BIR9_9MICO|nr:glycosyltransferase [Gryllotalpicola protaetiae]AYG03713.1 glycosyltransferase [Gryllotalpicola protaetiae]